MTDRTLTAEDKRDLADGDWWREACEVLGARLVGWTFRQEASILFGLSLAELDGRVADKLIALATAVEELKGALRDEGVDVE